MYVNIYIYIDTYTYIYTYIYIYIYIVEHSVGAKHLLHVPRG